MRHNVLIVDDEQLIRQGLRARIEYRELMWMRFLRRTTV